jgi:hypothetical protein
VNVNATAGHDDPKSWRGFSGKAVFKSEFEVKCAASTGITFRPEKKAQQVC